jgi:hypothetical protein
VIPEALYTDWTSKNIADYFGASGFRVRYTAVSQPVEAAYPFDRLYAVRSGDSPFCIFALQFKAPQRGASGLLRFNLDLEQLRALQKPAFRNWVFYALPYFTNVQLQTTALHLTNFTRPLQIPSLEPRSHFPLHWRAPFLMIEWEEGKDGPEIKELELYKAFNGFADTGKPDWILTRRACMLSDGTMRYEIPHVSWGELFQSVVTLRSGRHFLQQSDIEAFMAEMRDVSVRPQNAVLAALDLVKRTIEVVALLAGTEEARPEETVFEF